MSMDEIKIFYDTEREKEVKSNIEFEPVEAGKVSKRELFILNNINFKVNVEISVEGKDIKITKTIKNIIPGEIKKIQFEISPKITTMKPIKASFKIKLDYTLR